jgi:heat shock protein HslJ
MEIIMRIGASLPVLFLLATCSPITASGFEGRPDVALLRAGTWELVALSTSGGRVSPARAKLTATFGVNGRVEGMAGPNAYGGAYSATPDGSFEVDHLISTLIGGRDAEVSGGYLRQMTSARRFLVDQNRLRLHHSDGTILQFGRVDRP